ncbi:hypothetical protein BCR34DRAFT_607614 [Clohesyomyces aquaticus]|uniref:Uncharacterized protein n=1 Tax=Clohesyomyces aquaticus TaxID=1231657 RepID=A0A1Y1YEV9_9PLEO|nr:hypothetical protein BCR34DRAFT_607614 [Clohesyomyces aquaticus]
MSGSSPRFTPVKKGTMDDRQFLNTSSGLGRRLIRLRDKDCPASKEFLYMGREVNSFHATYQILRPHIHSSSHLINRDGQALVERIYDGIGINCNSIELKVRSFEQRLRNGPRRSQKSALKAWLGGHSNEQDKAYRRFFESNAFTLERCQIRCADLLLKVVLAVLVYAQNIHNVEAIANFPDESHHLIEGLEMAWGNLREIELRALQSEATEARPVRVQARGWWEGLPFQPLGTEATILERLTWLWVNHEARLAARPNPAQEDFMAQIRYWRDHYNAEAELSRGLAQERHELRIQTQQLAADNEVLTRENAGFQGIIDELNEDILQLRRTLEEERNARRNEREIRSIGDPRGSINRADPPIQDRNIQEQLRKDEVRPESTDHLPQHSKHKDTIGIVPLLRPRTGPGDLAVLVISGTMEPMQAITTALPLPVLLLPFHLARSHFGPERKTTRGIAIRANVVGDTIRVPMRRTFSSQNSRIYSL